MTLNLHTLDVKEELPKQAPGSFWLDLGYAVGRFQNVESLHNENLHFLHEILLPNDKVVEIDISNDGFSPLHTSSNIKIS